MKKYTVVYGFSGQKIHARTILNAKGDSDIINICAEHYPYYDEIVITEKDRQVAEYFDGAWQ